MKDIILFLLMLPFILAGFVAGFVCEAFTVGWYFGCDVVENYAVRLLDAKGEVK